MRAIAQESLSGWVTTRRAAQVFGVSREAVERCLQRHDEVLVLRLGHTYLLRLDDLRRLGMRPVHEDD